MMENASVNSQNNVLEEPLAPKRTRLEEFWRLFRKNKLAIAGMVFFILFFALAIVGFGLTRGSAPILDPALRWPCPTWNGYSPMKSPNWAFTFLAQMTWDAMSLPECCRDPGSR